MYTINFVNKNPDIATPYVTFIQAPTSPANLNATYGSGMSITNGKSYSLETISYTLSMDPPDWQGHMYLSDAALVLPTVGGLPVDPTYTNTADKTRYQNLEFAGSSTQANPDITYINWYSIPLQMESTSEPSGSNKRGVPKSPAALAALLTTLPGLSGNDPTTVVKNVASQIARVISPNAGLPSWLPLYRTFTDYLVSVFIHSTDQVLLNNTYDGIKNPPSPDFQPQNYQTTSVTYAGLDLLITGSTSLLGDFTMTSRMIFREFSNVIYLAVMNYAWSYNGKGSIGPTSNPNGNTGDNNVFSAISRDLLAGFAYGFIGSKMWGAQPSSAWQGASDTQIFNAIQSHHYYNPWANAIHSCFSDVYTFPFNDFLTNSAPELGVNVGDTLTVTLLNPY